MAFHFKEIVKGLGWTCVGSSDSVAADSITIGTHYTDRWTAASKVVNVITSGAHSWIVMENQNLFGHFQYCHDMVASNTAYQSSVYISPTGQFSGGSTTARPTASDEYAMTSLTEFFFYAGYNPPWDTYLVGIGSSDGKCTRVFKMSPTLGALNAGCYAAIFDAVENAPSWWTEKYVFPTLTYLGNGSHVSYTNFAGDQSMLRCFVNSSTARLVRCTCEGFAANVPGNLIPVSDFGGDLFAVPVGLCIDATAQRGFLGNLHDAYWTNFGMPNFTVVPGAGGPWDWVKIGDVLWGFSGSAPVWTYNPYS